MGGHVVGFVATQPIQKGGACDADGCDKATSFLALCDSFNIPLVFLHDIPGFFIGRDAERKRVAAKIFTWMGALGMVTVPRVSIIVRKTYWRAYFIMGGGANPSLSLSSPHTTISSIFTHTTYQPS